MFLFFFQFSIFNFHHCFFLRLLAMPTLIFEIVYRLSGVLNICLLLFCLNDNLVVHTSALSYSKNLLRFNKSQLCEHNGKKSHLSERATFIFMSVYSNRDRETWRWREGEREKGRDRESSADRAFAWKFDWWAYFLGYSKW